MFAIKRLYVSSSLVLKHVVKITLTDQTTGCRTFMTKTKGKSSTSHFKGNTEGEIQYLAINSSASRWEDIPDGVPMDVGYYDTVKNINNLTSHMSQSQKVAIALHDTPGTHDDVIPLLQPLELKGYRVIAPSFPGSGITKGVDKSAEAYFTHSADEKRELIIGLVRNLQIKNVDLLIACGASADVAMRLTNYKEDDLNIRSLVLINPWPHKMFNLLGPSSQFYDILPAICDYKTLRFLAKPVLYSLKSNMKLNYMSVKEFVVFCYTVSEINFGEVRGNIKANVVKKIPKMIIYSEDDNFVQKEIVKEYIEFHGIKDEKSIVIGEDGRIMKNKPSSDLYQCAKFKSSYQSLIPNFSTEINGLIHTFIERVKK